MLADEGNTKIIFSENQVFFDMGTVNIISRLIEGEYPNHEQVIPAEQKEKVKIHREAFLAAAKRANIFTNPESQAIKLDISRNKVVISKNAPYIGEVREELDAFYGGGTLTIGFNPVYLIDVLKILDDEDIALEVDDADKPGVIRKGSEYIYVVLPMQLT